MRLSFSHPVPVPASRRQGGFMLLEVLAALLIFASASWAWVSMQTTSIRQSSDAQYRSIAALQAQNLISRMWLSDRTVGTLSTNYATGGTAYSTWLAEVTASGLPQVSSAPPTVAFVSGSNLATITIYWKVPGDSDTHKYIAQAQVK